MPSRSSAGVAPGGAFLLGGGTVSYTGRKYENITEWLREEYPEESEEEIERLADIVFRAWCDGVI